MTNGIDFSQYLRESEEPEETSEVAQDFSQYLRKEEKKPGIFVKHPIGRHIARSGSRVAETILGLPGDIGSFLQSGGAALASKLTGKPSEEFKKPIPLPTSENLKSLSKKLFGNVVSAESGSEELADNIISDAAALALPIKGKIPFVKSIGTSLIGNLSAEGIKELGAVPTAQNATKLGAFFLSGLAGKGNVKKFWNQQYKLAEESVPKNAIMNARQIEQDLTKLESELKRGGIETPSTKSVLKPINELKSSIKDGSINVDDAISAKRKINELRASLFDEVKEKSARKYAKTKLNDVSKALDKGLENYGKSNPDFYKHYKAGNEAYGGFYQSKRVGNYIKSLIPMANLSKAGLIAIEAIYSPGTIPATLGAYGAFKGGELLTRMFKNPTLKKYYFGILKSSIDENKTGLIKNLKGFDKEVQKDEDLRKYLRIEE